MEFNKKIGSWKYKKTMFREPAISLDIQFRVPKKEKWTEKIAIQLDTGYDGEILLAYDLFILAGYNKFKFAKSESIGVSITGEEFQLDRTNSLVKINDIQFDVLIETNALINENLIGRGFINKYITLLDGLNTEWSIYQS
ncbi:MAG: hypothetical protein INQ03_25120 [Candidatus Heimdallarchaeota archaeon]|nr:hypothetical protein [Candidatus Heimdallarchaeota archaeon]